MRTLLTASMLLAFAGLASAANLSGPLSGTLLLVDSPFLVTADIRVDAGESLSIEPGCELRFGTGTGFDVHGTLSAEGTAPAPIRFMADLTDWDGIDCFGANDCVFRHFSIRDADTGLHIFDGTSLLEDGDIGPNDKNGLRIESDDVTARRLAIHESEAPSYTALFIYQASPELHDCEIWGTPGAAGVGVWGPAAPLLQDIEVHGCLSGITCVASSPRIDAAWIHDNGFAGNFDSGAGIYVGYAGGEPLVTNSLIEGNCFGVSVVLDGRINLGDLVNDFPEDDGLNRFVGNDLYDGTDRHLWNGTTNSLLAQNCFWAAADGVFSTDTALIDTWIIDDEEGEGAEVLFEPLAEVTAAPSTATLESWSSYPNPANPSFTIRGDLPGSGRLQIRLYTPAGRHVTELMDAPAARGAFEHTFKGYDLPSGLYLARIDLDGRRLAGSRLVILR